MRKYARLAAIALLILTGVIAAPAHAQQGRIVNCRGATVVPGTTPMSCDVSGSRVEYQGAGNGSQVTLSCLWAVQNNAPIADPRYALTHQISPGNGAEQITLHIDNQIIAIVVAASGPIQTEILTPNGPVAKLCNSVDIANFTASGCRTVQPFIPPQLMANNDAGLMQQCRNYVAAMAAGGSITAPYFDPNAANARLINARALAATLGN